MEIRLKLKYRNGASYKTQKSSSSRSGKAKHGKKAGKINHVPMVMVVDGRTGHRRMVRA